MSSIKEKYKRFRQWQEQPFEYQDGHERHVCCNCGAEFDNNYCPRCGQKSIHGPVSWNTIWRSVLNVWAVGTRSFPYSLWQLLWRPGCLIRDYISGKRQVSFPPVKMLVVMALLVVLVYGLLGIGFEPSVEDETGNNAVQNFLQGDFYNWMSNHIHWAVLMSFSLFIVPVWFIFRLAPRLPRHTLPQGFFIQVFIGVQFLLYLLMITLVLYLIPPVSGSGDDAAGFMLVLVLPLMLLCDYRQLFGYSWWGTLWRIVAAIFLAVVVAKVLVRIGGLCYSLFVGDWSMSVKYLLGGVDHLAMSWAALEFVLLINTKPWREGVAWSRMLMRPLVAVAALLLTTAVCGHFGIENSLINMLKSLQTMFLP